MLKLAVHTGLLICFFASQNINAQEAQSHGKDMAEVITGITSKEKSQIGSLHIVDNTKNTKNLGDVKSVLFRSEKTEGDKWHLSINAERGTCDLNLNKIEALQLFQILSGKSNVVVSCLNYNVEESPFAGLGEDSKLLLVVSAQQYRLEAVVK